MSEDQKSKKAYPSYNAMSRPAMFAGIPIMPLVGLFLALLVTFVVVASVFSFVWGVVAMMPFIAALCGLRVMTSIDDRYTRRVRFSLHRLWLNLKYGRQLLLTPYSPLWSKFYGKRISQQRFITGATSSSVDVLPRRSTHRDADRV